MADEGRVSMKRRIGGGILAAIGVVLAGGTLVAAPAEDPSLGEAESFAVLGASTVTNTGPTVVTGDVGVSPGTAITGFPPGIVTEGALHAGDTAASDAHRDASIAYLFLEGMASIPANNLSGTDLGGLTLEPGVYKFNSSAQLTGDLVLDAGGDSDALFVFQIGSTLTTGTGASVTVINGGSNYDESRVFWQIGSSATLGVGTEFLGNILAYASITIVSGSSLIGRALAINAAVTMDTNAIVAPSSSPGNGNGDDDDGDDDDDNDDGDDDDGDDDDGDDDDDGNGGGYGNGHGHGHGYGNGHGHRHGRHGRGHDKDKGGRRGCGGKD